MKKTKTSEFGNKCNVGFAPNRFTFYVPKIKKEYFKDGTRYYLCDNGKVFQADIYDTKLVAPKVQKKLDAVVKQLGRGQNLKNKP